MHSSTCFSVRFLNLEWGNEEALVVTLVELIILYMQDDIRARSRSTWLGFRRRLTGALVILIVKERILRVIMMNSDRITHHLLQE